MRIAKRTKDLSKMTFNELVQENPRAAAFAKGVAEKMAGKNPKNEKEIAVASGYSLTTARAKGAEIKRNETFQEVLRRLMPPETILKNHLDILENSDDDKVRLEAAKLGYGVSGIATEKKDGNSLPNGATVGLFFTAPNIATPEKPKFVDVDAKSVT